MLLAVGFAVVGPLDGSSLVEADRAAAEWLARHRTGPLDTVTGVLSSLVDTYTVIGAMAGSVVVLAVLRRWRQVVVLAIAVPLELAVFLTASFLVDRPRPDVVPLDPPPITGAFPSGHVAVAICLYGGAAVVVASESTSRRVTRIAVAVAAVLVVGIAVARVYRGLHFPLDVVGGVLLGLAALAVAVVAARLLDGEDRRSS